MQDVKLPDGSWVTSSLWAGVGTPPKECAEHQWVASGPPRLPEQDGEVTIQFEKCQVCGWARGHYLEDPHPEVADVPTFSVIEYGAGFVVVHNPTGAETWMSDGVDALHDEDGVALIPGTPGFTEEWAKVLNSDKGETLSAYFPEIADREK